MRRRVVALVTGSALALAVAVLAPGSGGPGDEVGAAGVPVESPRATAAQGRPVVTPTRPRLLQAAPGHAAAAGAPLDPGAAPASAAGTIPAGSSVSRALATYSADELALLAEFERLTGRAAPPELLVLIERRRARDAADELAAAARQLFAGDPLGRAAALRWLRAHGQR